MTDAARGARVAIIHDWLTGMRGGEKVLEEICLLYPDATLFTFVRVKGSVSPAIERHRIKTSWVQRLPRAGRWYRHYLLLYPFAVESFDLDGYDLVISSSHCAVKSVIRAGGATHVCYCHSPMRYAWDQFPAYFGPERVGTVASALLRPVMAGLARWDAATAGRVDCFLANSQYVAGRIRRYYNRGSTVVYPPVDTNYFQPPPQHTTRERSALVVSALVPYKRIEVAIEAARLTGIPLRIVGRGPDEPRLRKAAGDAPVEFLGWRTTDEIRSLYQSSSMVLIPGVEDFGIVAVEAQACGTPVVAIDEGGTRETIVEGVTGALVPEGAATLADGMRRVVDGRLESEAIRANAERFSREVFRDRFIASVADAQGTPS
ncbi:MAG: glycosyltransferase [Acidobacteria bacterium]|nr:glycosyltransferase [Acidobacteriota bacterium]